MEYKEVQKIAKNTIEYARRTIRSGMWLIEVRKLCENKLLELGVDTEKELHEIMKQFVTPHTTFEELYYYMNKVIEDKGYVNLDFLGNLGHSIVKQKDDRI